MRSGATGAGSEATTSFKSNTVQPAVNRARDFVAHTARNDAGQQSRANQERFDRNYHRRSNVESVFSAPKRKFGENIRSKTPVAQVNEVLRKLIAYNLTVVVHEMFENGIAPQFSEPPRGG